MGQINLSRTQFKGWGQVTSGANDDVQTLDFVGYFRTGDTATFVDVDACGNILSTIASGVSVDAIDYANNKLFLGATVDTTSPTGTVYVIPDNIDDGEAAIDRLYRDPLVQSDNVNFAVDEPIVGQVLNEPIAGQTTFYVADAEFLKAGDTLSILADEGVIDASTQIVSVTINADDSNNQAAVVVNEAIDTSSFTNPYLLTTDVTVEDALHRLQEDIDMIDKPIENEYVGAGDCNAAFEADNLFVEGTSKVYIDGVRKRLGTAGTRASLTQGTADAAITLTSMILGTDGNDTQVAVVSGAGLTVTVSGNYVSGYTISVNDNGGAATAADIAAAINADADAKRLVQAQYGGTGAGTIVTFAATNLTGGLDDGVGDYAELEQVYNNAIANTGYKWIAFHIRPSERNRMNQVPQDDEEVTMDYRQALVNVDR